MLYCSCLPKQLLGAYFLVKPNLNLIQYLLGHAVVSASHPRTSCLRPAQSCTRLGWTEILPSGHCTEKVNAEARVHVPPMVPNFRLSPNSLKSPICRGFTWAFRRCHYKQYMPQNIKLIGALGAQR